MVTLSTLLRCSTVAQSLLLIISRASEVASVGKRVNFFELCWWLFVVIFA